MMNKDKFINLYISLTEFLKESDKLIDNPVLNSEYILDFTELGWNTIEDSLLLSLNKDQVDWIYWWFFEKPYVKDSIKAKNALGKPIPTETKEDLWNILLDYSDK